MAIILALVFALLPATAANDDVIYAKPHEYPSMVRIEATFPHLYEVKPCSGVLIAEGWVMTAAHCVYHNYEKASRVDLLFGKHDLLNQSEFGQQMQVSSTLFVHPKYGRHEGAPFDVAMIRLDRPILLSHTVRPIYLPTRDRCFSGYHSRSRKPDGCSTGIAVGWPVTAQPEWTSSSLRKLEVEATQFLQCSTSLNRSFSDSHLCLKGHTEGGVCLGDSSTAFICCDDGPGSCFIAGIAGPAKCPNDEPAIFSRICRVWNWIHRIMKYKSLAKACSDLPSVPNGSILRQSINTAQVICDSGFSMEGVSQLDCTSGNWSESGTCVKVLEEEPQCHVPKVENGHMSLIDRYGAVLNHYLTEGTVEPNSILYLTCDYGYASSKQGFVMRLSTCVKIDQREAKWFPELTTCDSGYYESEYVDPEPYLPDYHYEPSTTMTTTVMSTTTTTEAPYALTSTTQEAGDSYEILEGSYEEEFIPTKGKRCAGGKAIGSLDYSLDTCKHTCLADAECEGVNYAPSAGICIGRAQCELVDGESAIFYARSTSRFAYQAELATEELQSAGLDPHQEFNDAVDTANFYSGAFPMEYEANQELQELTNAYEFNYLGVAEMRCTGGSSIGKLSEDMTDCKVACESNSSCMGINYIHKMNICIARMNCELIYDPESVFYRKQIATFMNN